MKSFFLSKINILSIIVMLVSLSDFIKNYDFSDITVKGWITFAIALIIMLLRTFFANVPVTKAASADLQEKLSAPK